jgi:2-polyprenyl-6-methoxyphenol hydroxylase-like FAD-dependent oxidoreductase
MSSTSCGVGYDVAEKVDLLPQVRELGYQVRGSPIRRWRGRKCSGFSTGVVGPLLNGRFTTLRRSDLAATIYRALDGKGETIFNDSVAAIVDERHRVRVSFDRAAPREVDLVVGADGLHPRVRRLAFGPETRFEVSLGSHVAAFDVEGYRPRDELVYVSHGVPGRQFRGGPCATTSCCGPPSLPSSFSAASCVMRSRCPTMDSDVSVTGSR